MNRENRKQNQNQEPAETDREYTVYKERINFKRELKTVFTTETQCDMAIFIHSS